jgi:hypothetical protein
MDCAYSAVLANPRFTETPTSRGFNRDFLLTYLLHPGTALYVDYNSNLSKPGPGIGKVSPGDFTNDGVRFSGKLS